MLVRMRYAAVARPAWLLRIGSVLWLVACGGKPSIEELSGCGVRIRKVRSFEAPAADSSAVVVIPGDFVITAPGLRVVVGGEDREPSARGALLEAIGHGMSPYDGIAQLTPLLYVRGIARRIAVLRMRIIERASMPRLRIEGAVQLGERWFGVSRELAVANVGAALSITTRVATRASESDVRLGVRIAWGGPEPFLPLVGELRDDQWHRADWVGGEGATGTSLFGYADDALLVRASYEVRGSVRLLQHTDVVQTRRLQIDPGTPHEHKTLLAVSAEGLGRSVRRLGFWRGAPFPEAWVNLPYQPPGSEVRLFDEHEHPLLSARPDAQGRVPLPLIAAQAARGGRYIARATAYGHNSSDPFTWRAGEPARFVLSIPVGGRIRVRARDLASAEPLPARVRLLPLGRAAPLQLGPDYRASGAGDTVIAVAGDATIVVPQGRYRVLVTRGPEWSLYETAVDVTDTFSPLVEARLEHEVSTESWVSCDLHVHAMPSPDSEITLQDRLASLRAEGVRFAVATDHDHVTDYAPTARELGIEDLLSVSGVEITTREPQLGHFNAYPYPLDPQLPGNGAPNSTGLEPTTLFRSLHDLDPDLVVQVNHPRSEGGIGYFDLMHFEAAAGTADPRWSPDFDAIEVWNGFDLARPERMEQVFRDWLAILQRGQRVVATGSSDSHQLRYQLAGYPRTYAHAKPDDGAMPLSIVRALKAGASFVTSGPFLQASVSGVEPGGTVIASSGVAKLDVRVRTPDWMTVERLEVFVGDELVLDRALAARTMPPARARKATRPAAVYYEALGVPLSIPGDTFVVVRVSSTRSLEQFFGRANVLPMAFTNPIFIDADGDGHTPWSSAPD